MYEDEIKIEKLHKIVDVVEKILQFNRQNQEGQGLKILTPDQMLSRSPITLAQLKQEIIQKSLKMKQDNYYIFYIIQGSVQKQSIKI